MDMGIFEEPTTTRLNRTFVKVFHLLQWGTGEKSSQFLKTNDDLDALASSVTGSTWLRLKLANITVGFVSEKI